MYSHLLLPCRWRCLLFLIVSTKRCQHLRTLNLKWLLLSIITIGILLLTKNCSLILLRLSLMLRRNMCSCHYNLGRLRSLVCLGSGFSSFLRGVAQGTFHLEFLNRRSERLARNKLFLLLLVIGSGLRISLLRVHLLLLHLLLLVGEETLTKSHVFEELLRLNLVCIRDRLLRLKWIR